MLNDVGAWTRQTEVVVCGRVEAPLMSVLAAAVITRLLPVCTCEAAAARPRWNTLMKLSPLAWTS